MTEHRWTELVAPYALGALTGPERDEFESHLEGCDICRRELNEMNEVGRMLAHGAPPAAPPPRLRERIIADARRAQVGSGDERLMPPVDDQAHARATKPARAGARARVNWIPWLAAAASVVFALMSLRSANEERATRGELARAVDEARAALAGRDSLLASLLSPQLRMASLVETAPNAMSPLRMFHDPVRRRVVLIATNLRPAPDGRDYQAWAIVPGRDPISLGTFNTSADGTLIQSFQIPEGLEPAVGAVTLEPDGGSPQPTSTPILAGQWRRVE